MAQTNFSQVRLLIPKFSELQLEESFIWILETRTLTLLSGLTYWHIILAALLIVNLKNLPLIYHLRLLNAFRFVLRSQRPAYGPNPEHLFQPMIVSSRTSLWEIDIYLHKSNSAYFPNVDVARTHLVCTLFSKGIEKVRGGTAGTVDGKLSSFAVVTAAVSCTFRRELKPYERYDMWTRILSWDDKWLYTVTHFVKRNVQVKPRKITLYPNQNIDSREGLSSSAQLFDPRSAIAATVLSKLVFKNGKITIKPATMLEHSGLLPLRRKDSGVCLEGYDELAEAQIRTDFAELKPAHELSAVPIVIDEILRKEMGRGSTGDVLEEGKSILTWEMVERERQRGLKSTGLLADQNALDEEFHNSEALGRHSDGTGLGGVLTTLAQLGLKCPFQWL